MKLVRDKIPDIIRARGDDCDVRVCHDDFEYNGLLFKKIAEEFNEAEAGGLEPMSGHSGTLLLEELADLTEVIHAMLKFRGWTVADLERVRKRKRRANGGFEKRLVLEGWWKK